MNSEDQIKQRSELKVLIVEDEAAIAMLIEDMFMDFGCEDITVKGNLAKALEEVGNNDFDICILDVNLGGEQIYPLADVLQKKEIPFIFSTGYGGSGLKDDYKMNPVIQKPFLQDDLAQKLHEVLPEFF